MNATFYMENFAQFAIKLWQFSFSHCYNICIARLKLNFQSNWTSANTMINENGAILSNQSFGDWSIDWVLPMSYGKSHKEMHCTSLLTGWKYNMLLLFDFNWAHFFFLKYFAMMFKQRGTWQEYEAPVHSFIYFFHG